jgi:hypothetical protein
MIFNNTTKTVVVSGSPTVGAGNWAIGNTSSLKIIKGGGSTMTAGLVCTDCSFHDYARAVTGGFRYLHIENCDFDRSITDHIAVSVTGTETHFQILRNRFLSVFGSVTDPQDLHCDAIQLILSTMTQDNTTTYEIVGNIIFPKGGRSHSVQGIFCESIVSPRQALYKIDHNIIITCAGNGIIAERPASGSTIQGNTLLFSPNTSLEGLQDVPSIATYTASDVGTRYADAGAIVAYNVAPNIATTYSLATIPAGKNHLFGTLAGQNDNTDYAAVFTGTDFDPENIASLAAFKTAITQDPALAASDAVLMGALNGYYDYDTGVDTAPW